MSAAVSLQRLASEGSDASTASTTLASHLRPDLIRRETDHILSYYQSEHAGRSYIYSPGEDHVSVPPLMRESSSGSVSSSQYSDSEDPLDGFTHDSAESAKQSTVATATAAMGHTRRPSQPSEGSADRRRLAIVELDSTASLSPARRKSDRNQESRFDSQRGAMAPNGLLSRRGIHVHGLALVAPPDASPRAYTDLTPPTSAPITAERVPASVQGSSVSHQRSRSEVHGVSKALLHHQRSRDVGIVGSRKSSGAESLVSSEEYSTYAENKGLKVPIFQTPTKSRSPSPAMQTTDVSESSTPSVQLPTSQSIPTPTAPGRSEDLLTPAIGEYKDIQQPVVGPVVVGISSDMMRADAIQDGVASPSRPDSQYSSPRSYDTHDRPSPYLFYEPGVHSTAGPLPAPPAPMFSIADRDAIMSPPPPRPPRAAPRRDIDALKEALQLPKSVSAVLASRPTPEPEPVSGPMLGSRMNSGSSGPEFDQTSQYSGTSSQQPMHIREGAFPPSTLSVSHPQQSVAVTPNTQSNGALPKRNGSIRSAEQTRRIEDDARVDSDNISSLSTDHAYLKSPPRRSDVEVRREDSWVSLGQGTANRQMSPNGGSEKALGVAISLSMTPAQSPTPPPKSLKGSEDERASLGANPFRATLSNLKRFSALPRTPSFTSSVVKSQGSHHSRTPSPPAITARAPRPKIISAWPDAMHCYDVMSKKSALERSKAYAQKINELAIYDCGLTEWVTAVKHRGSNSKPAQNSATRLTLTPATPSLRTFTSQPRHISHGSIASEMTFPTRADAYTATDLSTRSMDVAPSTAAPPALPYPSLATSSQSLRMSTLLSSPSRSLQLPLPSTRSGGMGFFSSIGRKSSMKNNKDMPSSPSSPAKVLMKRMPNPPNNPPRPVQITTAPLVPGGPRAAPGRVQRSQTYSVSPSPPAPVLSEPSPSLDKRQSSATRRPSLFTRSRAVPGPALGAGSAAPVTPTMSTPEFERQVDKLADLLPHADRVILAGYLRRAGQDILAIGQYLEDEKNGTLH
ncbi:hypothetical protein BKA93DRAFT_138556 [Sparassis latifolia]